MHDLEPEEVAYIEDWLARLVEFYRRFGFFGAYRKMSVEEVVDKLVELELAEGRVYDPDELTADIQALRWDKVRVWTEDPFRKIVPEEKVYEETLGIWSKISRKAFEPEKVKERWESPQGGVWVEMMIHEHPYILEVLHQDYVVDLEIIKEINQLMLHPFLRFHICDAVDDIMSVLVLTPEERVQIERERGLVFHVHDLAHLFEACSIFLEDHPEPQDPSDYFGSWTDELERPIGKLQLRREGRYLHGTYKCEAEDYPWSLELRAESSFTDEDEAFTGTLGGFANGLSFTGAWKGQLSKDERIVFGTWIGKPIGGKEMSGTFGALEEQSFKEPKDAYIEALVAWVRRLWEVSKLLEAPPALIAR